MALTLEELHKEQLAAGRAMLAALKRSLRLVEKQDADSGCIAYMEQANQHRAAIAQAKAAGIVAKDICPACGGLGAIPSTGEDCATCYGGGTGAEG